MMIERRKTSITKDKEEDNDDKHKKKTNIIKGRENK